MRPQSARIARMRAWLQGALRVLRTVLGAPDYARYAAHMRSHHPGQPLLTPEAFARERLAARYDRPGSRCC